MLETKIKDLLAEKLNLQKQLIGSWESLRKQLEKVQADIVSVRDEYLKLKGEIDLLQSLAKESCGEDRRMAG